MQRLFIAFIAFVVVLAGALGALLYVSLIPFFHTIGIAATALLLTTIACGGILVIAWTFTHIQNMLSHRNHTRLMSRVVQFENGAAALDFQGNWVHLSAQHQQAMVPLPQTIVQQLPSPKKPDGWTDEATILELWSTGNTLQTIVETTGMPYNTVQKITSDAKKSGAKRAKKSEIVEE